MGVEMGSDAHGKKRRCQAVRRDLRKCLCDRSYNVLGPIFLRSWRFPNPTLFRSGEADDEGDAGGGGDSG